MKPANQQFSAHVFGSPGRGWDVFHRAARFDHCLLWVASISLRVVDYGTPLWGGYVIRSEAAQIFGKETHDMFDLKYQGQSKWHVDGLLVIIIITVLAVLVKLLA